LSKTKQFKLIFAVTKIRHRKGRKERKVYKYMLKREYNYEHPLDAFEPLVQGQ